MPPFIRSGVTLIEMIITLAVLSIVLALSAPGAARWVRQSEIRSSAESLRSALQRARIEAVSRNARVRVTLGDAEGRPQWQLGCVRVNAACPAQLIQKDADSRDKVRWGAATAAVTDLSSALDAGSALPGSVDFFPLGDARQVASDIDIARIDVFFLNDANAGRLVVRIDSAGNVSFCDPQAGAVGACP